MPSVVVDMVSAGIYHSLLLTTDNQVYGWGDNALNQLGAGAGVSAYSTPTDLSAPTAIHHIEAAEEASFLTGTDGKVYVAGKGTNYQLGTDSTADCVSFCTLSFASDTADAVYSGRQYAIARTTGGQLWSWGSGPATGHSTNPVTSPTQITFPGGATISQVAAGYYHVVAVTSTGDLYTWGDGTFGVLFDGNVGNHEVTTPALIHSATTPAINTIGTGDRASYVVFADVNDCPANTYRSAFSCQDCAAGSASPAGSMFASDCVPCDDGYYGDGLNCTACPEDTYLTTNGLVVGDCINCPTNQTSPEGSTSSDDCTAPSSTDNTDETDNIDTADDDNNSDDNDDDDDGNDTGATTNFTSLAAAGGAFAFVVVGGLLVMSSGGKSKKDTPVMKAVSVPSESSSVNKSTHSFVTDGSRTSDFRPVSGFSGISGDTNTSNSAYQGLAPPAVQTTPVSNFRANPDGRYDLEDLFAVDSYNAPNLSDNVSDSEASTMNSRDSQATLASMGSMMTDNSVASYTPSIQYQMTQGRAGPRGQVRRPDAPPAPGGRGSVHSVATVATVVSDNSMASYMPSETDSVYSAQTRRLQPGGATGSSARKRSRSRGRSPSGGSRGRSPSGGGRGRSPSGGGRGRSPSGH